MHPYGLLEGPEEWAERKRKESWRNKTVLEGRNWSEPGYECEICQNFDLDTSKCAQGKRPTKFLMLDGPNEHAHFHGSCKLYEEASDEIELDVSGQDRYFQSEGMAS